jgi:hypothetical protein
MMMMIIIIIISFRIGALKLETEGSFKNNIIVYKTTWCYNSQVLFALKCPGFINKPSNASSVQAEIKFVEL